MKNVLKRSLSVFLALTIIFSSAIVGLNEIDFNGIFAVKAEAASVSDLTFTLNDDRDSYSVTGCNKDAYGVAIIPSTYKGLPVTSIGDYAFRDRTSLTSITIPDSVTSIGYWAFWGCTSLTSITIPDGVTSIDESAFCYCSSLTSITIPASVTSIGSIYGCTSLTSINVNEDNDYYSSVNGVLFNKDKTVLRLYPSGRTNTSYTVPNGVTSIGNYAFFGCTSLTSITIPDSVTSIGYYAFKECTSLTSITIPDGVTSIDFRVFYDCTSLTSITIPDGVTSIGDEAFRGCTSLTSITIPDSVTSIGDYAFGYCTNLTSITIPDSVTSIGSHAFYDTAYYNNSTNWDNEVLYIGNHLMRAMSSLSGSYAIKNGTRTIAGNAFYNCDNLTSVAIPDSVTSIGDEAFYYCTNLTSITIPDSVTSIGDYAFKNCSSLASLYITDISSWCNIDFGDSTSNPLYYADNLYINDKLATDIVVPNGVTTIPVYGFSCVNVTSVKIPDSVTSIVHHAFTACKSLKSVTIPDSVTSIGDHAFSFSPSLESVIIPDSVTSIGWMAFYDTADYNDKSNWENDVLYIGNHLIYAGTSVSGLYSIRTGTKTIADYAFRDRASLTGVTIPDGVTRIGNMAFWDCTSLTGVTIPDSVTSIGSNAFRDCSSLKSVTIPDSVTSIGDGTFENCTSLTGVTIPDSVTRIGNWSFGGCSSLASLYITDISSWCNIDFGNSTSNPLYYADNLYINDKLATDIVVPNGVTTIPAYGFSCVNVTSIKIPDSVTSIVDHAFYNCDSLKYIFYPGSKSNWNNISIGENNKKLTDAIIHYNSENHDYSTEWTVDKVATCTEDGSKHKECSVCGELLGTEVITKTGHKSSDWITDKEATCTKDGSKHKECTVCGEVLESVDVLAEGHIKSDWIIDSELTCTQDGSKHKECTECGETIETATIAKTGHTPSDWITDKKATVNAAGSKHKECTVCGENLEEATIKQLKCAKPSISKIANKDYGVRFEWKAVDGADSYKVYRKVSGGSYKLLGTTTKTAFADKTAKSGTKYYYVVKATNEVGDSEKSASKGITFLAMPTIKTIVNASTGVKLTWGKVSGAEEYKVYRKTSSGSYAYIGKTTSTSYTDKTAKSGTKYYYVVKAVNEAGSSEKSASKSVTFLVAPIIKTASSKAEGIIVKWNKITGASGYYVYRKASGGDWRKIATVKGNSKIKYLDETPRKGGTYQYKVKAYNGSSTSVSSGAYKIKCKY